MPELPEVETIKIQLEKVLVGKKILSVDVLNRKIFAVDEKRIVNSKIKSVRRFGKALVVDFSNNYSLLVHIKMTGQFVFGGKEDKHTIVVFNLANKKKLIYRDIRKFSWVRLTKTKDVEDEKFIKNLGPDALKISLKDFTKLFGKSKKNVKVFIMDQSKISGIGNIYANDALWLAKVLPTKESKNLRTEEIRKLYKAMHTVLKNGLKNGGASENDYIRPDGTKGDYQNHTLVYGREGKECKRPACRKAGKKIKKFFISNRGTYWCSMCQK